MHLAPRPCKPLPQSSFLTLPVFSYYSYLVPAAKSHQSFNTSMPYSQSFLEQLAPGISMQDADFERVAKLPVFYGKPEILEWALLTVCYRRSGRIALIPPTPYWLMHYSWHSNFLRYIYQKSPRAAGQGLDITVDDARKLFRLHIEYLEFHYLGGKIGKELAATESLMTS